MPAIITPKFRFHNAEQFKESFSEAAPSNYYLFIGRPGEFADTNWGGTDSAPPTPVGNRSQEAYLWDDMLAAKKIQSTGVSHAIPRRDLDTSGNTKYDMYRPDYSSSKQTTSGASNLFDSTFYFMTSAYRVYKVLDNNGGQNIAAGANPTHTDDSIPTVGGYALKYMYTLSSTDIQNFLTPDFIPVPTAPESNVALVDGGLYTILQTNSIAAANASQTTADQTVYNIPIRGDGVNAMCSVVIGASNGSNPGKITSITISNKGSGYTHASLNVADIQEQFAIQQSPRTLTFTGGEPTFEVIIGPDGGHGSNPAKELGGNFIIMDTKLQTTESFDFSVVNDFRQVGIVRDPLAFSGGSFSGSTARQTYAIKLNTGAGAFTVDQRIEQQTAAVSISAVTRDSNTGSVIKFTATNHNLVTGSMVDITTGGGSFGGSNNQDAFQGSHFVTRIDANTFSITVSSNRAPDNAATFSGNMPTYTVYKPEGIVVEYDASNLIVFYVQTSFDSQGTNSTHKNNLPFGGGGTITNGSQTATANTSYSSTLNNTVFVNGYANPEMKPDSGDVIYVENRKPISRASDQTEDIKLIVEF